MRRLSLSLRIMLLWLLVFASCKRAPEPAISFYYWKTIYRPGTTGLQTLKDNNTRSIYLRYFDVVYDQALGTAIPAAPVQFREKVQTVVVPVVFIRNAVFEQLRDSLALDSLAGKVVRLCGQISTAASVSATALQIDCDWTQSTSASYFLFLRCLRRQLASGTVPGFGAEVSLSVTIRLHQVKYPDRSGIPPADKGMLMYYNMGSINNTAVNSIYDRQLAQKYLSALPHYPLALDLALPVFAWGIHLRDGKVLELLNGTDSRSIDSDTGFVRTDKQRYKARNAFFRQGFYFRAGDEVKIEEIPADALLEMAKDIHRHNHKYIHEIVFYDLDSQHISRYDPDIFKKVARHIN